MIQVKLNKQPGSFEILPTHKAANYNIQYIHIIHMQGKVKLK